MTTSSLQPTATASHINTVASEARCGLFIYFALLVPLSACFEWLMVTHNLLWVAPLMWTPTLASVVARLALGEGFADVSFRLGGRRGWQAMLFGLFFPVVIGLAAYGAAWATGLALFVIPTTGLASRFLAGLTLPAILTFMIHLLTATTVGTALAAILATGEEIGWRGYMLTRLIDAGIPRPVLVSNLIWALWHLPLTLVGVYAAGPSPVLSAALLLIGILAIGQIIAWLRLNTGSVWPAIVFHAAWNSLIQGPFDQATIGPAAKLWTGESGILTMLALVIAALIIAGRPWTMLRQPPQTAFFDTPFASFQATQDAVIPQKSS
jgi:membrane protease YdiL (CAAX protease family)